MKQLNYFMALFLVMLFVACENDINFTRSGSDDLSTGSMSGQGGSLARFAIVGDYLYAVDDTHLKAFNISHPETGIEQTVSWQIDWWGVETIFPMGDKLFLGTTTGMHIVDISDPGQVKPIATYEHVVSCDPVVAQGNYAYVTLNDEQWRCGRAVNELHVIDISNIKEPVHKKTVPMTSPKGLGIDDSLLFVCDKDELKVFNAKDPLSLQQINSFYVPGATDVIANHNILILISKEGLTQYSYENANITQLSSINVE